MNLYKQLNEMPITGIRPNGWLRKYMENQRNGLTGHLEAAGFPFDCEAASWAPPEGVAQNTDNWCPYEQKGYWIDGMIRCGYLLEDSFLIEKAKKEIDYVLANPDHDGYLGPLFLKEPDEYNRWVHAVFFRAIIAYYSATNDTKILETLTNHYLKNRIVHSNGRNVCNIEIMLWLYEQTKNIELLKLAEESFIDFDRGSSIPDLTMKAMLSDDKSEEHGVTYNEIGKLGAILYMYTGKKTYLDASVNVYNKIDKYHMLIDGVLSSSEHLRGKDPLDSHETCDIADYTWSLGYLLMATGKVEYADKIERACFNAAPGAVKSDFKALQYFSCPNQVIADRQSNHNKFFRGKPWMSYRPNPGTECCPGDVNRIIPNYASRMWMSDQNNEIIAVLYGPSSVTLPLGEEKKTVTIIEETAYPFSDRIDFQIIVEEHIRFPLKLRIPTWCHDAKILVNGSQWNTDSQIQAGTFVTLDRTFSPNDRITLILPMKLTLSHWPRGGIGIERGPLVYALRIEEDWRIDKEEPKSTKDFPAWNLYAASPWNYALYISVKDLDKYIKITHRPMSAEPWTIGTAPIELKVPARRVKGWDLDVRHEITEKRFSTDDVLISSEFRYEESKGHFKFTPQLPDEKMLKENLSEDIEEVTLIPYGCTKLRIAIFPWVDRSQE